MIDAVKLQKLQAGVFVYLALAHQLECFFRHSIGLAVAVVIWIFNQLAVGVEQAEIYAPAIYADAPDLGARHPCRLAYTCFNLGKQLHKIPSQRAVLFDRPVAEAMDFFEDNFFGRNRTEHHSAALGSKINSDIFFHFRHR